MKRRAFFDEMTAFPFGEHDDLLDAAATGTAYLLERPEPRVWRLEPRMNGCDAAVTGTACLLDRPEPRVW